MQRQQAFQRACLIIVCLGPALATAAGGSEPRSRPPSRPLQPGERLKGFELRDLQGRLHRLSESKSTEAVVLAFNAVGCPISRLYAPRLERIHQRYADRHVKMLGVNANRQDDLQELRAFVNEYGLTFPVLKDYGNVVADRLGARRTTEVFVFDSALTLRYRGRIDDQYSITDRSVGITRQQAEAHYLTDAIDALLAGHEVRVKQTRPLGCVIGRVREPAKDSDLTFYQHVEPIIQRKCQSCHRPGQIAPFELLAYEDVAGWSGMIREVVLNRRMPPWHADPRYGEFANDRSLSAEEIDTLIKWIDSGTPAGEAAAGSTPAPQTGSEWLIGTPDVVFEMPEAFHVPAEGVVDYQYFSVKTGIAEDRWVQAAEIRPGNRRVVHHILVFAIDPKNPGKWQRETLGGRRGYFAAMVPGERPAVYPPGMAKRLPAGATLVFQVHYTPIGRPQKDRSRIGLIFADRPIQHEVHTKSAFNERFLVIPPHTENCRRIARYQFDRPSRLLSFLPHMHLRGQAFRYVLHSPARVKVSARPAWEKLTVEAMSRLDYQTADHTLVHYGRMPDPVYEQLVGIYQKPADRRAIGLLRDQSRSETLLSIPAYDFGWQNTYRLKAPKPVPAGAILECVAHYNNSPSNPALTRDMWSQTVRWGPQTWDEMLIGYFDFVYASE